MMEINRAEFINSLAIAEDALGDNTEPNEQSRLERQSFRIDNNRLYATNGAIAIETLLPFDTGKPGIQCLVHGKQLLDFLRSLSTETVKMEFDEKELKISAGKVKGKFNIAQYKEHETIIDKLHKNPPTKEQIEKLIKGLEICKRFVHKDKTQGTICGVYAGNDFVLASDRRRIAKQMIDVIGIDCVVPLKFIEILLKHRSEIYSIQIADNHQELQAFFGNSAVATVLYSERYPEFDKFFPADATGSISVLLKDPAEFYKALNRHIGMLENVDLADRDTKVIIDGQTLTLSTTGKSIGVIEESFEIYDTSAKDISFLVDPLLLKQSILDNFLYYQESKLVLFVNTTGFKCLLQTRRPVEKK